MAEIWTPIEDPERWERFCAEMAEVALDNAAQQRQIAEKWLALGKAAREASRKHEQADIDNHQG